MDKYERLDLLILEWTEVLSRDATGTFPSFEGFNEAQINDSVKRLEKQGRLRAQADKLGIHQDPGDELWRPYALTASGRTLLDQLRCRQREEAEEADEQ